MTLEDDDQMNVLTIHQEGRHRTPVRVTIDYEAETIRSTAASAATKGASSLHQHLPRLQSCKNLLPSFKITAPVCLVCLSVWRC